MREVKSISNEKEVMSTKSDRNLSKGGTDRREHKLNLSIKKIERGKKE